MNPKRREKSVCRGWVGASLVAVVAVSPWASAQSTREIEQQLQQAEQVKQLTERLEQELQQAAQQVEDEQRALLDRLGRTHDELQNEKQRNRELERQLEELLGNTQAEPSESAEPSAAQSTTGTIFVPRVERRINSLGLVKKQQTVLAPVPPGVNGLALRLAELPGSDTQPFPIELTQENGEVSLGLPTSSGNLRTLATLTVNDGQMVWAWESFSPSLAFESLPVLDERLRFAVIETLIDGVVVGRYQFEPDTVVLSYRDGPGPHETSVSIPLDIQASFAHPTQGEGWVLIEDSSTAVVWAQADRSVQLRLEGSELSWQFGPGIMGRLEEVQRQQELWQQDLQRPQSGNGIDRGRAEQELQNLIETEGLLRQALDSVSSGAGTVDRLAVEIVGPRPNMILYRVSFASP